MKPKLRFKGYDEEWKFIPFSDNFSILKNNTLSREGLTNDPSSNVANIHYGDILVKFGEIINGKNEEVPWILNKSDIELNSQTLLKSGDVVFADTAEDEAVGKCVEVIKCENKQIVSGLHTIPARTNVRYAEGFLGYYLNSPSYHNTLLPLMQGIKVLSLSKSAISKTQIIYPYNLDEQKEIGEYFQKLDGLIKETGKEIEKLENVKQASLQKMFPQAGESVPQLRFKDFTNPWKKIRVGLILTMERGLTFSPKDLSDKNNGVLVLRSSNIKNDILNINPEEEIYVKRERVNIPFISNGDILFTASNGSSNLVGKHCLIESLTNIAVHGGFMLLGKSSFPFFTQAWLSAPWYKQSLDSFITGGNGALGNFQTKEFLNKEVFYPASEEEIKAIGEFFRNLDKMISAKKKKLEKLKQIKKSCLNLMFV